MPAVARITWHNNFGVSLPIVSSDFITGEELNRRESLSSNQSTTHIQKCTCVFGYRKLRKNLMNA